MRKLLLQLDSSPHPSVFDRVVAYDAGADEIMSHGGVTDEAVRDLVHGCIFTRGPKDLKNTAIFIGGTDMAAGERLLAAVRKAFFGPMRVSVMLDSNGGNTTAVAAVVKLQQAVGDVQGHRAVITAGTGPVGVRAAGLLARAGADVSRSANAARCAPVPEPAKTCTRYTCAGSARRPVAVTGSARSLNGTLCLRLQVVVGSASSILRSAPSRVVRPSFGTQPAGAVPLIAILGAAALSGGAAPEVKISPP